MSVLVSNMMVGVHSEPGQNVLIKVKSVDSDGVNIVTLTENTRYLKKRLITYPKIFSGIFK